MKQLLTKSRSKYLFALGLIAISIGVLLGILVSIPIIIRTRKRNSRLEKKIKDTKKINRFHVMPED